MRYTNLKSGIFSQYRTLSELLRAILLREARAVNINVMCETSGRDVAMVHYVDHFFPDDDDDDNGGYRTLTLHFTINDLSQTMTSIDLRKGGHS